LALDFRTSRVDALSGPWECPSPRRPSLGRESRASFRGAFAFRRLLPILSHLHARKRPQTRRAASQTTGRSRDGMRRRQAPDARRQDHAAERGPYRTA
jgi:hypothetical protein